MGAKTTPWRLINCVFFGLSSGLPLLTTGGTLQAWMKNEGIDITTIGLFALVGLPYSYKFLWSPALDRYAPFPMGRRKSWMLISQTILILLLLLISTLSPSKDLMLMSLVALTISFWSATQDIALDAYRREILSDSELGLGSSLFVAGYRIGLLISGALALYMSATLPWSLVYVSMAAWMLIGVLTTILSEEPTIDQAPPRSLWSSIVDPLKNFFQRSYAWEILLFVLLYKIGDALAATMSTPFILDIGFTNKELGLVGKTFGLSSAILGGILGGMLIPKLGLARSLGWFGIIQMISILAFSLLAVVGPLGWALALAISVENLTSGMGTSAFLAFLSKLCDRRYSATQYAILSSIVALPRTLLAAGTGYVAKETGWVIFFVLCTLSAIPALLLLLRAPRWKAMD